jgi:hypothetical protein
MIEKKWDIITSMYFTIIVHRHDTIPHPIIYAHPVSKKRVCVICREEAPEKLIKTVRVINELVNQKKTNRE